MHGLQTQEGLQGTDKRLETLRAQCALVGVTLHRLDGDDGRPMFIVSHAHWALTKQLDTLDDVDRWLKRVSGQKAVATP